MIVTVGTVIIATLIAVVIYLAGQRRRLQKAKEQAESTARAATERVEQTVAVQGQQQKVREEAREEKESLEACGDSDLPDRANNLFG